MDDVAAALPDAAPMSRLAAEARDYLALRARILDKLTYQVGRSPADATQRDWFAATAHAIRDFVVECWLETGQAPCAAEKRVYYLSLEFLIGRLLFDAAGNLGLLEPARAALASVGVDMDGRR